MSNPWQDAAQSYGQGLNQLSQTNAQTAQMPMQLAQMFQQSYLAAKKQKMAEAEQERRLALDESMNRHRMEQETAERSRARELDARVKRKEVNDISDDVFNQYTGTPDDEARFSARYAGAGVENGSELLPKGEQAKGTLPTSIGEEDGQPILMPGVPSEQGEIVPGSNVGGGVKLKRDALANKSLAIQGLNAYREGKTLNDSQKLALKTMIDTAQLDINTEAEARKAIEGQARTAQGWAQVGQGQQRIDAVKEKLLNPPKGISQSAYATRVQAARNGLAASFQTMNLSPEELDAAAIEQVNRALANTPTQPSAVEGKKKLVPKYRTLPPGFVVVK